MTEGSSLDTDSGLFEGLAGTPGRKLAAGRDADVFEFGAGRVLRRYRNGRASEREAEIMRHARAHRYPVPTVFDARGPDMVMERVDGPTMLADLSRRPWMLWRHARTLARLHRRLATIPPLPWMQPFPLGAAAGEATASGSALLHLDLHPDNVIISARGPIAIDWSSAKRGEVSAAVALTWVIMATSEIPGTGLRAHILDVVRQILVEEFLRHADKPAALRQLPAVARFRIADRNVRPSEQLAIQALLGRHGLAI